jgi:S-adenosylmethionine decarboxylase
MRRLGRHAIVDVTGADRPLQEAEVTSLLAAMATACGATLLKTETHHFGEGHGLTAVAVLAESHLSLHEWPEYQYIAFDIFVCGSADPESAVELIRSRFPSAHVVAKIIDRGSQ